MTAGAAGPSRPYTQRRARADRSAAVPSDTEVRTDASDSASNLGLGRNALVDVEHPIAVTFVMVILDPVEGVILCHRLRLTVRDVRLEQVPPSHQADDDVEQERLDAADEHLEVPVTLLMHQVPEGLPLFRLEREEPAPEEEVDPQRHEQDHGHGDE